MHQHAPEKKHNPPSPCTHIPRYASTKKEEHRVVRQHQPQRAKKKSGARKRDATALMASNIKRTKGAWKVRAMAPECTITATGKEKKDGRKSKASSRSRFLFSPGSWFCHSRLLLLHLSRGEICQSRRSVARSIFLRSSKFCFLAVLYNVYEIFHNYLKSLLQPVQIIPIWELIPLRWKI